MQSINVMGLKSKNKINLLKNISFSKLSDKKVLKNILI